MTFNPEDIDTIRKLKDALSELPNYKFRYLDNHSTLERDLSELRTDLVFNLCDEGWNNDPFKELHVPALLEVLGIGYTGAGPAALAACYDKGLVRAVAQGLDVPVPLESYVRPGDQGATLPSVFPALLKPNQGDSSQGITKDAVVTNEKALLDYLDRLRARFPAPRRAGAGIPDRRRIFRADDRQSGSGPARAAHPRGRLLQARSEAAENSRLRIEVGARQSLLDSDQVSRGDSVRSGAAAAHRHSSRLFERLGCRDYARFDFRADAKGEIKLLEVNPNPGWCWDGKMNLMAGFQGMRYSELLGADPAGGRGTPGHHGQTCAGVGQR